MSLALFDYADLSEDRLGALACAGDHGAFGAIMQRCNARLYRTARGILGDEAEAEDVLQEAYVRAFAALPAFRGEASLVTWLTTIVVNEARGRLRRRRPQVELKLVEDRPPAIAPPSPEAAAAHAEARRLLERAIDALPADFRAVFVLREVEGCSVAETAAALGASPVTVRTRLHRARALLKKALEDTLAGALTDAFPFGGKRCAALTQRVLARLRTDSPNSGAHDPMSEPVPPRPVP